MLVNASATLVVVKEVFDGISCGNVASVYLDVRTLILSAETYGRTSDCSVAHAVGSMMSSHKLVLLNIPLSSCNATMNAVSGVAVDF